MNSLAKHSPGMIPRRFSQYIAQKLPENRIPSTHTKAIKRSANRFDESRYLSAHAAFLRTGGMVSIAWNKCSASPGSAREISAGVQKLAMALVYISNNDWC